MSARCWCDEEKHSSNGRVVVRRAKRVAQHQQSQCARIASQRDARARMRQGKSIANGRPGDSPLGAEPLRKKLPHGRGCRRQCPHNLVNDLFHVGAGDTAPDAANFQQRVQLIARGENGCLRRKKSSLRRQSMRRSPLSHLCPIKYQPASIHRVWQGFVADPAFHDAFRNPKGFRDLDNIQKHGLLRHFCDSTTMTAKAANPINR